jgi:hypothetical protein
MNLKHVSSGGGIPTARNVLIGEVTFTFEPDEEGGYRVLAHPEQPVTTTKIDVHLLRAVAEKLARLSH